MERNALADKLKGYACFLVLFGHVIMGIRLADVAVPNFFEGLEKIIWSFHVALFLFISGAVYKLTGEWKGKKTKSKFLLHKLIGLGIPYVVFSVIYILINSFVGQTNTAISAMDVLSIWHTPIAQYWFLYALFFLFCIWTLLSGFLKNWQITLLTVLISFIAPLCSIPLGSFEVVFATAIAFGAGTCINIDALTKPSNALKCVVIVFHLVTAIVLVRIGKIEAPLIKELMLLFGIYASILLISILQDAPLLGKFFAFMNKYSFQTYLLHTIFTAGIRIVLLRLGVTSWIIHVAAGLICGLGFSVLVAKIAERIKFFNFFFFPTKYIRKSTR